MPIHELVLFSAAITVVFTKGKVFSFLRRGPKLWRDLVSCALCSGVWVGAGMSLLFWGFPHAGGELWTSVARLLGAGSLTGCAALLFVAVWDWLEERPPAVQLRVERIDHATMPVANIPQISATRVKIVPPGSYADEAPTDPSTSDSRLTKKVSTERLPIAESRRSLPGDEA